MGFVTYFIGENKNVDKSLQIVNNGLIFSCILLAIISGVASDAASNYLKGEKLRILALYNLV